jgi:hypothetical protein
MFRNVPPFFGKSPGEALEINKCPPSTEEKSWKKTDVYHDNYRQRLQSPITRYRKEYRMWNVFSGPAALVY